jgi:hypothetical protein
VKVTGASLFRSFELREYPGKQYRVNGFQPDRLKFPSLPGTVPLWLVVRFIASPEQAHLGIPIARIVEDGGKPLDAVPLTPMDGQEPAELHVGLMQVSFPRIAFERAGKHRAEIWLGAHREWFHEFDVVLSDAASPQRV